MRLKTYIEQQGRGSVARLAELVGVHRVLVSQWTADNPRDVPITHCAAIEQATAGAVMRWDLRPDDWHKLWPELLVRSDAPAFGMA